MDEASTEVAASCSRFTVPPATELEKFADPMTETPEGAETLKVQESPSGPLTGIPALAFTPRTYANDVVLVADTLTAVLGILSTHPLGHPIETVPSGVDTSLLHGTRTDVGSVSIAATTVAAVTGSESSVVGDVNWHATNMVWFAATSSASA